LACANKRCDIAWLRKTRKRKRLITSLKRVSDGEDVLKREEMFIDRHNTEHPCHSEHRQNHQDVPYRRSAQQTTVLHTGSNRPCSQRVKEAKAFVYTVSQKVYHFYFCDCSVKYWLILILFGNVTAEKICNLMTYSLLIISILCINITKKKNKRDSV